MTTNEEIYGAMCATTELMQEGFLVGTNVDSLIELWTHTRMLHGNTQSYKDLFNVAREGNGYTYEHAIAEMLNTYMEDMSVNIDATHYQIKRAVNTFEITQGVRAVIEHKSFKLFPLEWREYYYRLAM